MSLSITAFVGQSRFLNTCHPVTIWRDGQSYMSVLAAFHASPTDDPVALMRQLTHQKFTHQADLCAQLLATGDALLIAGLYDKARFWGTWHYEGHNWLGVILMEARTALRRDREWQAWKEKVDGNSRISAQNRRREVRRQRYGERDPLAS